MPTPRLDAEVLMATAMSADRAALYARLRDSVPGSIHARFLTAMSRRLRREPVAYIAGAKEFCSLPFAVTPAVLIPRPETEQLVDIVRRLTADRVSPVVCDLGTGSGCVAVAIARTIPDAQVVATDVSRAALAVARQNAVRHGVAARVRFIGCDLWTGIGAHSRFDVVVSNPPYLRPGDLVSPEVDWEPAGALVAGPDGLAVIRRLVQGAPALLREEGSLVMEFGQGQADAVRELAAAAFASVAIESDLAAIPRVLVAAFPRRSVRGGAGVWTRS